MARRDPCLARAVEVLLVASLTLSLAIPASAQQCTIQRLCNSGTAPYSCRPYPATPARFYPEAGYRPKDFTIVEQDGWYHLFYIKTQLGVGMDQTEKEFGHARSRNLYDSNWEILPSVLQVRPDNWDNFHVWAPYIVKRGDTYDMFYTGVTNGGGFAGHQRIGLATSQDLTSWTRLDAPVFSCAQAPWTYCDPAANGGGEFRDPFVMEDPATPGRWLMYCGAGLSPNPYSMRPELAVSNGDFTQWTNAGPLWSVHDWWTQTTVFESPHLFSHGNLWFIVFTTNSGQPLEIVTTAAMPSDTGAVWNNWNRVANLDCVNSEGMVGSEYFKASNGDEYFANYVGNALEFRQIDWNTGDPYFRLLTPVHVTGLGWNSTSVFDGDPIQLTITTSGPEFAGRVAKLELFEVDDTGAWDPVPLATLGLPDAVTLAGTSTAVAGTAHRIADPDDSTPDVSEYVVRYLGETQVLRVNPVPCCYDPPPPDPEPILRRPNPHRAERPRGEMALPLALAVRGAGSPGPLSLVVDLPSATSARLELFDVRGRRLQVMADRDLPAGETVLSWTPEGVANGTYFARLLTPLGVRSVRLTVRN